MTVSTYLKPDEWLDKAGGPLYLQLRQRISQGVKHGTLKPGSSLPAEREIASITGLSRVTVRKAIQSLAQDGVIVQKQGSGSFIAKDETKLEQPLSRLTSFSEDMARRGKQCASIWMERGVFVPSPDDVLSLALTPDTSVVRLARLRTADDIPMAIERATLSTEMLPDPLMVDESLYRVLDAFGRRPVRALQKISAINLNSNDAALLDVDTGAAGLSIERTSYLANGQVVEFTHSIFRGDAYNFVAELRLAKE